jgi:hypothetical protein
MSWLSSFLHPERGYEKGQEQLDKYYQIANAAQNPYNQMGQQQGTNQQKIINELMNPQALQDKWASGYKESEAAKNLENMASQQGLNAASSMGLLGSNTALNAIQSGTSQIGAADRQQYMDDLMKKYLSGAGLSQNMYNTGANTANSMGQNAMNMGSNSAQMAFGQQNAPGDMFSKLLQGIVSFATPMAQGWGMNKLGLGNNAPWSTSGGGNHGY